MIIPYSYDQDDLEAESEEDEVNGNEDDDSNEDEGKNGILNMIMIFGLLFHIAPFYCKHYKHLKQLTHGASSTV